MIVAGVLAAGLPLAVHWLTRPRPVRWPCSTLRFLQEAVRQRRARHRLRDVLLLALRTLAVLAFAAALARPLTGRNEPPAIRSDAQTVRVVLLDASQSMAAQVKGIRHFDRARPLASALLEFRPGLKVNLIVAAAKPAAEFAAPSSNFAALREALARAAPLPERLNLQPALNQAAEMLASAAGDAVHRELTVISDFQRTNWASADFSTMPADTAIRLESVAPPDTPGNLALLRVAAHGRAEVGRETMLEADVGNFSATPQRVRVQASLGDALYRWEGSCPAYSKTTLSTPVPFRGAGWQTGEARLMGADDPLPADDVRPCVLDVRPPLMLALITAQSVRERPSSSYYLERALAPVDASGNAGSHRLVRLSPDGLDPQSLSPADVIVVDHPGKLSAEAIGLLASLLNRGRGILYVAADPIDAANLKLLSQAAGAGLRLPVEWAPALAAQPRRNLFLTKVRRELAPFALFGDSLPTLLSPLRFSGGLTARRAAGGLDDDVLATFNDGIPCLTATSSESGTLAVLNADLAGSNLPASPVFVPLLGELVDRTLARDRALTELACGEPMGVYLPADAGASPAGLAVSRKDAPSQHAGDLVVQDAGLLWRAEAAGPPGIYQVRRQNETLFAVVAATPEAESDLRTMPTDVLTQRLAGGRDVQFHSALGDDRDKQDTLWTWLALACAGCLLGEVMVLRWFRT